MCRLKNSSLLYQERAEGSAAVLERGLLAQKSRVAEELVNMGSMVRSHLVSLYRWIVYQAHHMHAVH